MSKATIGFTEAKNNFSALTTRANASGESFVVLKNNKPWVEVVPLSRSQGAVTPVRREARPVDLDDLFANYDGSFTPVEDGFAGSVGQEEL